MERCFRCFPHPDINSQRAHLSHARCCWRIGREEAAIAAFTALVRNPEEPEAAEAWRLLAEIAEKKNDYIEAERAYREVIASSLTRGNQSASRGRVQINQNSFGVAPEEQVNRKASALVTSLAMIFLRYSATRDGAPSATMRPPKTRIMRLQSCSSSAAL